MNHHLKQKKKKITWSRKGAGRYISSDGRHAITKLTGGKWRLENIILGTEAYSSSKEKCKRLAKIMDGGKDRARR